MFSIAIFLAAQATLTMAPATVDQIKGPCPGAYIDYGHYHRKYHDENYVPISVQLDARDALRKCAKEGINVPATVAEYNQRQTIDPYTEMQIKRNIAPSRPWGEF